MQTSEGVLGQQAEIYKVAGRPLGFVVRNVSYSDKDGLEEKNLHL